MSVSGGPHGDKVEFKIFLRPLSLEDARAIWHWHNSEELYQSLLGECQKPSFAATETWLRTQILPDEARESFAICERSSDRHIGNVYLRDIDRTQGSAEFHILIGDPIERGKGFGRQALRMTIDHAFQNLGLRRLFLKVLADNLAAIKIYTHCGFKEEHRLLQSVKKRGVLKDVLVMSLVRNF